MKKILRAVIIAFATCLLLTSCVYAHQNAAEHYEELEAMLFDNRQYVRTLNQQDEVEGKKYRAVRTLEWATTLCIDQFGDTNGTLLKGLKLYGVKGLPSDVSKINPDEKAPVKLSARNHRQYTHQGWDHAYSEEKNGDLAKWGMRKKILLSSVEKTFDFSLLDGSLLFLDFGYSPKCNSFSAVLYYSHLLGDYLEDQNADQFNGTSNGKKIPFARTTAPGQPDIFSELMNHLDVMFSDQKAEGSREYSALMGDLRILAEEARSISGNGEGTINEENYSVMHECVQKLMDMLTGENGQTNYIHRMLMREKFFTDVFEN